jgi:hypothetical protein
MDKYFRASPRATGTDGFFTAIFIHNDAASQSLDKARG